MRQEPLRVARPNQPIDPIPLNCPRCGQPLKHWTARFLVHPTDTCQPRCECVLGVQRPTNGSVARRP